MANYILVENRQIIHLGPMPWRSRMFQSVLDDLGVSYTVSPTEQGYVKINENFELIPVGQSNSPDINEQWEDPIGPFWTYTEGDTIEALPTFYKKDKPIDQIRQFIKDTVAAQRYIKESAGTQVEIRTGVSITADTSRDGRAIFVQVYSTLPDGASVNWKFPEGWYEITRAELGTVIAGGFAYIQSQFEWEKSYTDRIYAATDIAELKTIYEELTLTNNLTNFSSTGVI